MDLARQQLCTTRLLDQSFGMCITPQDLIRPFYNFHGTNYFRPWKFGTESASKDIGSTIDSSQDKFRITVDVQHFQPNEVSVKVTDKGIIIEGKHEEREDDHGFIARHFTRRYALPNDCLSETVTSTLSSDGVLFVTADKKYEKIMNGNGKVVPIKTCGISKTAENTKTNGAATEVASNENICMKKENESDKKDSKITLKEDHCRLLKPELLREAVSGTEKLLTESRKETDELLKLISSDKSAQMNATKETSGKLGNALGQCKTAIAELTEKFGENGVTGSSEMSSMKSSMMSETIESMESSSSISMSSSTSSTMKASSEKTSELLICAELKEAAELI